MLRTQPWALIVVLAAYALIRPIFSILGLYKGWFDQPVGPLVMTVNIAVIWGAVAVIRRLPRPYVTLALAGAVYGVLALILNVVMNVLSIGDAHLVPVPGAISMIVVEAIFGAACGAGAWVVMRVFGRTPTP